MNNKVLVYDVPKEFKDKLPINVFFVKGKENNPIRNTDLVFVESKFYSTKKMRCYNFYKAAFI